MKIAYYSTIPSPPLPGTESVNNDIRMLLDHFKGEYIELYPFKEPYPRLPWQVIGLNRFRDLQKLDKIVDIHHIFSSGIRPYPVLRTLKRPVIYTVVSGIQPIQDTRRWPTYTLVVESERDLNISKAIGIKDCRLIRYGIDTSRIKRSPLQLDNELTLLLASAPWIYIHFQEKGFDLLFKAVSQRRNLRLVILMRGLLADVLRKRLKLFDIEDRVTVFENLVDINSILSQVHGTIVLSEHPGTIRSYPHSLLESFAAGKPVLISDTIAMADYVRAHNLGCIVGEHSIISLNAAIDDFMERYDFYRGNTEVIGAKDFSKEQMVSDYFRLYSNIIQK